MLKNCQGIIVDDDIDAVDSLTEHLEKTGLCVLGRGYNGEDAYNLYKKLKPKFVILDMKMPVYDGAYAIKKIKDHDPNAKIIVVTGFADYNFALNEITAVLTKPYPFSQLKKILEEICDN